jgi:hypothetical protein
VLSDGRSSGTHDKHDEDKKFPLDQHAAAKNVAALSALRALKLKKYVDEGGEVNNRHHVAHGGAVAERAVTAPTTSGKYAPTGQGWVAEVDDQFDDWGVDGNVDDIEDDDDDNDDDDDDDDDNNNNNNNNNVIEEDVEGEEEADSDDDDAMSWVLSPHVAEKNSNDLFMQRVFKSETPRTPRRPISAPAPTAEDSCSSPYGSVGRNRPLTALEARRHALATEAVMNSVFNDDATALIKTPTTVAPERQDDAGAEAVVVNKLDAELLAPAHDLHHDLVRVPKHNDLIHGDEHTAQTKPTIVGPKKGRYKGFNVAKFLFVSTRVAEYFPGCVEAQWSQHYHTVWPKQSYAVTKNFSAMYNARNELLVRSITQTALSFVFAFVMKIDDSAVDLWAEMLITAFAGYVSYLAVLLWNTNPFYSAPFFGAIVLVGMYILYSFTFGARSKRTADVQVAPEPDDAKRRRRTPSEKYVVGF